MQDLLVFTSLLIMIYIQTGFPGIETLMSGNFGAKETLEYIFASGDAYSPTFDRASKEGGVEDNPPIPVDITNQEIDQATTNVEVNYHIYTDSNQPISLDSPREED